MLQVHLSPFDIANCQNHYLEQGWEGAEVADDIRIMASKLAGQARSFGLRQERRRGSILPDGRRETLESALFAGPHGWPWGAAHFLSGLQLDKCIPLADPLRTRGDLQQGRGSYCAPMTFGPDIARSFGELIALVVYLHHSRTMWIVWIGPETDLATALDNLRSESSDFAEWHNLA